MRTAVLTSTSETAKSIWGAKNEKRTHRVGVASLLLDGLPVLAALRQVFFVCLNDLFLDLYGEGQPADTFLLLLLEHVSRWQLADGADLSPELEIRALHPLQRTEERTAPWGLGVGRWGRGWGWSKGRQAVAVDDASLPCRKWASFLWAA